METSIPGGRWHCGQRGCRCKICVDLLFPAEERDWRRKSADQSIQKRALRAAGRVVAVPPRRRPLATTLPQQRIRVWEGVSQDAPTSPSDCPAAFCGKSSIQVKSGDNAGDSHASQNVTARAPGEDGDNCPCQKCCWDTGAHLGSRSDHRARGWHEREEERTLICTMLPAVAAICRWDEGQRLHSVTGTG